MEPESNEPADAPIATARRTAVRTAALLLSATVLLAAGCGSGEPTIAGADVEEGVAAELAGRGIEVARVVCPDALGGVVGSTVRCEIEFDGDTYGANVSVTESDGGDAVLSVKVDDEPT